MIMAALSGMKLLPFYWCCWQYHKSLFWCAAAFVTFRLFDILKPYPIRYFDEKLTNGFGIMVDDILAAGYSILVILALAHFI